MGRRYKKIENGEVVMAEKETLDDGSYVAYVTNACCDCGLVHHFTIENHRKYMALRFWRDNRATGQKRRYRNEA